MGKGIEWAVRSGGDVMERSYKGIGEPVQRRGKSYTEAVQIRTYPVYIPYLARITSAYKPEESLS